MLEVVYPQIKAADPEAQVLLGGLLLDCDPVNAPTSSEGPQHEGCTMSRFIEDILRNGGAAYFDGVSYHAYDYYYYSVGHFGNSNWHSAWDTTGPTLQAKGAYLRNLLAAYGASDKYLMATEVTLLCSEDCDEDFEITKAYYLAQAYAYAIAENNQALIWFDVYGSWRHSGLIYPNGAPRPAYYAYQTSSRLLGATSFVREVPVAEGVTILEFQSDSQQVWLVWSKDDESHDLTLPSLPMTAWDVFGDPITPTLTLETSIAPVYLVWDR